MVFNRVARSVDAASHAELDMAIAMTCWAYNSKPNDTGYSPSQWVLGKFPNVPTGDRCDDDTWADYGILTGYGFSGTFCLAGLQPAPRGAKGPPGLVEEEPRLPTRRDGAGGHEPRPECREALRRGPPPRCVERDRSVERT